jgi:hypothetical protein
LTAIWWEGVDIGIVICQVVRFSQDGGFFWREREMEHWMHKDGKNVANT